MRSTFLYIFELEFKKIYEFQEDNLLGLLGTNDVLNGNNHLEKASLIKPKKMIASFIFFYDDDTSHRDLNNQKIF